MKESYTGIWIAAVAVLMLLYFGFGYFGSPYSILGAIIQPPSTVLIEQWPSVFDGGFNKCMGSAGVHQCPTQGYTGCIFHAYNLSGALKYIANLNPGNYPNYLSLTPMNCYMWGTPNVVPTPPCTGDIQITASPNPVQAANDLTTAAVSGLDGCSGKTVHFKSAVCSATDDTSTCIVSGSGCTSGSIPVQYHTYSIVACIDLNSDGSYEVSQFSPESAAVVMLIQPGATTTTVTTTTITATTTTTGMLTTTSTSSPQQPATTLTTTTQQQTTTTTACACTAWQDSVCLDDCGISSMLQTRTCFPQNCQPQNQCSFSISCILPPETTTTVTLPQATSTTFMMPTTTMHPPSTTLTTTTATTTTTTAGQPQPPLEKAQDWLTEQWHRFRDFIRNTFGFSIFSPEGIELR